MKNEKRTKKQYLHFPLFFVIFSRWFFVWSHIMHVKHRTHHIPMQSNWNKLRIYIFCAYLMRIMWSLCCVYSFTHIQIVAPRFDMGIKFNLLLISLKIYWMSLREFYVQNEWEINSRKEKIMNSSDFVNCLSHLQQIIRSTAINFDTYLWIANVERTKRDLTLFIYFDFIVLIAA